MTARDLDVNAQQRSVRRTARDRPQVKYTIDMRSDDSSDSEESRNGEQEHLSRFQTSLGKSECVHYVEKAISVAQEQYTSLLTGLQAVGQVQGWKVQQLVFVGGTCGSVHVESFNENMKALGVLERKWDLIRQKLVRRLLEEQDKVLRAYFAQKGGARSQRGAGCLSLALLRAR
jgi:hypothetical protein